MLEIKLSLGAEKILASEKSGAGTEDVCVTSVWYFRDLEFLYDYDA